MHLAWLGPDGLVDLGNQCVREATSLATELNGLRGVKAPVHDRHHFREFAVRTDQPATAIAGDIEASGCAVHVLDDHLLQVCVTDVNASQTDELVDAFE